MQQPTQPRWNACAIVLAGGKSRRMGADKSMMMWDAIPLIQRIVETLAPMFAQVLVSTNTPETHAFLRVPMVRDAYPDCGPMGGIASTLEASAHDANFVIACDIPAIPVALMEQLYAMLADREAAVPICAGRYEPLFAWYRKSIAGPMRDELERGDLKLQKFLAAHRVATVEVREGAIANVNTPEDLARAKDS